MCPAALISTIEMCSAASAHQYDEKCVRQPVLISTMENVSGGVYQYDGKCVRWGLSARWEMCTVGFISTTALIKALVTVFK